MQPRILAGTLIVIWNPECKEQILIPLFWRFPQLYLKNGPKICAPGLGAFFVVTSLGAFIVPFKFSQDSYFQMHTLPKLTNMLATTQSKGTCK